MKKRPWGGEIDASTEPPRMLYGLYFLTCMVANPTHCVMRVHRFNEDRAGCG
jgi:hypothetical protein